MNMLRSEPQCQCSWDCSLQKLNLLDHSMHYGTPALLHKNKCVSYKFINLFTCRIIILIQPVVEYPSCLQTTLASLLSQLLSQIDSHCPPTHTSTVPSVGLIPLNSLTSPLIQARPLKIKICIVIILLSTERNFLVGWFTAPLPKITILLCQCMHDCMQ